MEDTLRKLGNADADPVVVLTQLVECIRPKRAGNLNVARQSMFALCFLLEQNTEFRANLRGAVCRLLTERKPLSLYTEAGIFSGNDVFSETLRRLSRNFLLPDAVDLHYLRDVVAVLFHKASDHVWVEGVETASWVKLLEALRFDELDISGDTFHVMQIGEALRVLSYRIASIGLEPEVLRLDTSLEKFASPFIAQNVETLAYVDQFERWQAGDHQTAPDARHLLVLLDQCHSVADRIRARAARDGTSLSLTLQLQRLRQNRLRVEALADLLQSMRADSTNTCMLERAAQLASTLISQECRRNDLRAYMRQNVQILALRVTENAGHAGEHYITASRKDYFALLRSALGAGFVIAFMASFKIIFSKQHWTPLNDAIAISLNYGFGFVLIHMLGFSVATKQPAMTANAIAASIDVSSGSTSDLEKLTTLIARTIRSQTAAILGNVVLAVPTAMLISWAITRVTGAPFVGKEKAMHMLGDLNLFSGAIIYAAITGVCLFLSGQIAGWYDNLCAYNRIPERILQLKWPRAVFSERQIQRCANYVRYNLGALAGNFYFGCMLGGIWGIGVLLDIPLDIRHVAFASANIGYAASALNFSIDPHVLWSAIAGIAAIGITNLVVSFTLALWVALRARHVSLPKRGQLRRSLLLRFRRHTREFFLPPRRTENAAGIELDSAGTT
ncbi:site-specific recombinase [Dyella sp.]|uniref:site-specific recombinase n=1 Tax=Dyella sp. TaxID=1869338 RepID=UPI00284FA705|nr:site-specific recombinase [Dyella sp.]MDR3447012.1 site-specific recombinase [Dyella sp.]